MTYDYDRAAHRAAVEAGYASLEGYIVRNPPAPHAIPIQHDIFTRFKAIADHERTTAAAVINDALRKWLGDR